MVQAGGVAELGACSPSRAVAGPREDVCVPVLRCERLPAGLRRQHPPLSSLRNKC